MFAIVTGDDTAAKTFDNLKDVQAHQTPVIAVTNAHSDVPHYTNDTLGIPSTLPPDASVANVQLQLVPYHITNFIERSNDKPRNLTKSITVEWLISKTTHNVFITINLLTTDITRHPTSESDNQSTQTLMPSPHQNTPSAPTDGFPLQSPRMTHRTSHTQPNARKQTHTFIRLE